MFEVVLFQPEIPPNTGNIIRLCANTGARLHLIEPLGFDISDRQLRRAGLDYHESMVMRVHANWGACRQALENRRWFALTTKAERRHTEPDYRPGDVFVLGPETRGLPDALLQEFDEAQRLRLPMVPGSRSLNLSNAAAVMVFEAWRQLGFAGAV
ncbi:MAG: tRNA (cytidine(34)-2'-O)-methyltransferase [Betaproteobacteria bacterium]|nr:tRNA (cytidine(34)-2'-O)-methyltransferase [Betaproteobacteria bacterium]MDE2623308.1 tRNA (cytidine(34)-2'-O)-methyltransferase [Betaproteobacteria bacterium]